MNDRKKYIASDPPNAGELLRLFPRETRLVIFDIGACEAEDSVRYARLFPGAQLYAFEPSPVNIARAQENIREFYPGRIRLFPLALSDEKGSAQFFVSKGKPSGAPGNEDWDYGNKSGSLLAPGLVRKTHDWLRFEEKIQVETETLENFCAENAIPLIDFVHMDVQGAELKVLQGAGTMLGRIKAIWLEVGNVALYKNQPLREDIEAFLVKHGFYLHHSIIGGSSGDQLFLNKTFFAGEPHAHHAVTKFGRRLLNKITGNEKEPAQPSYSQSGEDMIISFVFNAIGIPHPTYIDIGAFHPFIFSNTAFFHGSGSTGINIEPNPDNFKLFKKFRKKDTNLNIGITDKAGEMDYYLMSSSTLNTFSSEIANSLEQEGKSRIVQKITMPVMTVNDVVKKYCNGKFPDLLTIDVEGLDESIIRAIDFDHTSPVVICVETLSYDENGHPVKNRELVSFLEEKGYLVYADTYINTIFVKRDRWIYA